MTPEQLERFEAKYVVDPNSGCWLWTATAVCDQWGTPGQGYGHITIDGRPKKAHRVSYEHFVGPIGPGLCVCHRCDVPACVNPAHLWVGTHADNQRDKKVKGRARNGFSRGAMNARAAA